MLKARTAIPVCNVHYLDTFEYKRGHTNNHLTPTPALEQTLALSRHQGYHEVGSWQHKMQPITKEVVSALHLFLHDVMHTLPLIRLYYTSWL
jgi:hypothetical protein